MCLGVKPKESTSNRSRLKKRAATWGTRRVFKQFPGLKAGSTKAAPSRPTHANATGTLCKVLTRTQTVRRLAE